MQLSITLEAMFGLNWALWKELIDQAERLGFAGLFRSDHFMVGKPGADSLDLVTSLTYLAGSKPRLHFGSLVAPLSVHHPVMLARQAMAINELSEGKMILGVGAGWHNEEHTMFGFHLGDKKTRMDRFDEGVQVIHALVHEPGPVNFTGLFFQIQEARLVPQSPVRIMVGGNGPTRTLPLVARYADIWNCQLATPDAFHEINARLDDLILSAGRQPEQVKRTMMVPLLCFRNEQDLDRHVNLIQQHAPPFAQSSVEEIKSWIYGMKGLVGSPQQVVDGLAAYAECGVEEIIIEWFSLYDLEGIELLGEEVINKMR